MIVPRLLGGGNKRPHGEYVDQLVVELLVGECVGGPHALVATNRLGGQTTGCGRCFIQGEGLGLDAEIVFRGLADEVFRDTAPARWVCRSAPLGMSWRKA